MDRKTLIGIVLCVLFYVAYTQYLSSKYPAMNQPEVADQAGEVAQPNERKSEAPTAAPGEGASKPLTSEGEIVAEQAPEVQVLTDDELSIETTTSLYQFSQAEGGIKSIRLKRYMTDYGTDQPIDLLDSPLKLLATPTPNLGQTPVFDGIREGRTIAFTYRTDVWKVIQSFTVPEEGYGMDVKLTFENISPRPANLDPALVWAETLVTEAKEGSSFLPGTPSQRPQLIFGFEQDATRFDLQSYCEEGGDQEASGAQRKLDFFGVDHHYFLKTLTPEFEGVHYQGRAPEQLGGGLCQFSLAVWQRYGEVRPNEAVTLDFQGFFGPKDVEVMEAFSGSLQETLDLGFFAVLARPLLWALKALNQFTHNFGWDIIIITLLLKIAFYPLTRQAAISMHKMKKLQPEMTAIREKFKDDPQRQQRELMGFMVKNKVNPMKGCLPILPQIPVFFAYYQVLLHAIELRHAPFFGWLQDLSAMDPYYVTPLLLGVCMVVQQKLTPTTGMDKNQERILMFMPVMFTLLMLTLPSGMVLYMLTNTIVSIAQQRWLNHKLA